MRQIRLSQQDIKDVIDAIEVTINAYYVLDNKWIERLERIKHRMEKLK